MSIIKNFTILMVISLLRLQCVNSQVWDLTDIENMDNLVSSWLTYGRQMYYQYQLEADAMYCITSGMWKIARNHIIEQSQLNPQISTRRVAEEFNGESIENYDITTVGPRLKRSVKESVSTERKVERGGLASLLGITGKQFTRDYDRHTVVRVKKSVNKTWNDDVKTGDLERAILDTLVKSNPMVGILLHLLGKVVYIIHSIGAFMKSSVVLSCVSDYTISRSSEFMYMNI